MILTADLHLTADPADEYRWNLFSELDEYLRRDKHLFILGDLTDRRDRHPSLLVNRLVDTLTGIIKHYGAEIVICMGNHDRPLYDAKLPYWHFLSEVPGLHFVAEPRVMPQWQSLVLLPYTDDPDTDWRDIDFSLYRAAFCHMPMKQLEHHSALVAELPELIYSGDEHRPVTVEGVTYVGAPHPKNFGDDYPCRVLSLSDRDFSIQEEIRLRPPNKHMLDISSAEELVTVRVNRGDAAKVRLVMPADRIGEWGQEQARIADWARRSGVSLASVEPVVEVPLTAEEAPAGLTYPLDGLFAFADAQGMDPELLRVGVELVEQAKGVTR